MACPVLVGQGYSFSDLQMVMGTPGTPIENNEGDFSFTIIPQEGFVIEAQYFYVAQGNALIGDVSFSQVGANVYVEASLVGPNWPETSQSVSIDIEYGITPVAVDRTRTTTIYPTTGYYTYILNDDGTERPVTSNGLEITIIGMCGESIPFPRIFIDVNRDEDGDTKDTDDVIPDPDQVCIGDMDCTTTDKGDGVYCIDIIDEPDENDDPVDPDDDNDDDIIIGDGDGTGDGDGIDFGDDNNDPIDKEIIDPDPEDILDLDISDLDGLDVLGGDRIICAFGNPGDAVEIQVTGVDGDGDAKTITGVETTIERDEDDCIVENTTTTEYSSVIRSIGGDGILKLSVPFPTIDVNDCCTWTVSIISSGRTITKTVQQCGGLVSLAHQITTVEDITEKDNPRNFTDSELLSTSVDRRAPFSVIGEGVYFDVARPSTGGTWVLLPETLTYEQVTRDFDEEGAHAWYLLPDNSCWDIDPNLYFRCFKTYVRLDETLTPGESVLEYAFEWDNGHYGNQDVLLTFDVDCIAHDPPIPQEVTEREAFIEIRPRYRVGETPPADIDQISFPITSWNFQGLYDTNDPQAHAIQAHEYLGAAPQVDGRGLIFDLNPVFAPGYRGTVEIQLTLDGRISSRFDEPGLYGPTEWSIRGDYTSTDTNTYVTFIEYTATVEEIPVEDDVTVSINDTSSDGINGAQLLVGTNFLSYRDFAGETFGPTTVAVSQTDANLEVNDLWVGNVGELSITGDSVVSNILFSNGQYTFDVGGIIPAGGEEYDVFLNPQFTETVVPDPDPDPDDPVDPDPDPPEDPIEPEITTYSITYVVVNNVGDGITTTTGVTISGITTGDSTSYGFPISSLIGYEGISLGDDGNISITSSDGLISSGEITTDTDGTSSVGITFDAGDAPDSTEDITYTIVVSGDGPELIPPPPPGMGSITFVFPDEPVATNGLTSNSFTITGEAGTVAGPALDAVFPRAGALSPGLRNVYFTMTNGLAVTATDTSDPGMVLNHVSGPEYDITVGGTGFRARYNGINQPGYLQLLINISRYHDDTWNFDFQEGDTVINVGYSNFEINVPPPEYTHTVTIEENIEGVSTFITPTQRNVSFTGTTGDSMDYTARVLAFGSFPPGATFEDTSFLTQDPVGRGTFDGISSTAFEYNYSITIGEEDVVETIYIGGGPGEAASSLPVTARFNIIAADGSDYTTYWDFTPSVTNATLQVDGSILIPVTSDFIIEALFTPKAAYDFPSEVTTTLGTITRGDNPIFSSTRTFTESNGTILERFTGTPPNGNQAWVINIVVPVLNETTLPTIDADNTLGGDILDGDDITIEGGETGAIILELDNTLTYDISSTGDGFTVSTEEGETPQTGLGDSSVPTEHTHQLVITTDENDSTDPITGGTIVIVAHGEDGDTTRTLDITIPGGDVKIGFDEEVLTFLQTDTTKETTISHNTDGTITVPSGWSVDIVSVSSDGTSTQTTIEIDSSNAPIDTMADFIITSDDGSISDRLTVSKLGINISGSITDVAIRQDGLPSISRFAEVTTADPIDPNIGLQVQIDTNFDGIAEANSATPYSMTIPLSTYPDGPNGGFSNINATGLNADNGRFYLKSNTANLNFDPVDAGEILRLGYQTFNPFGYVEIDRARITQDGIPLFITVPQDLVEFQPDQGSNSFVVNANDTWTITGSSGTSGAYNFTQTMGGTPRTNTTTVVNVFSTGNNTSFNDNLDHTVTVTLSDGQTDTLVLRKLPLTDNLVVTPTEVVIDREGGSQFILVEADQPNWTFEVSGLNPSTVLPGHTVTIVRQNASGITSEGIRVTWVGMPFPDTDITGIEINITTGGLNTEIDAIPVTRRSFIPNEIIVGDDFTDGDNPVGPDGAIITIPVDNEGDGEIEATGDGVCTTNVTADGVVVLIPSNPTVNQRTCTVTIFIDDPDGGGDDSIDIVFTQDPDGVITIDAASFDDIEINPSEEGHFIYHSGNHLTSDGVSRLGSDPGFHTNHNPQYVADRPGISGGLPQQWVPFSITPVTPLALSSYKSFRATVVEGAEYFQVNHNDSDNPVTQFYVTEGGSQSNKRTTFIRENGTTGGTGSFMGRFERNYTNSERLAAVRFDFYVWTGGSGFPSTPTSSFTQYYIQQPRNIWYGDGILQADGTEVPTNEDGWENFGIHKGAFRAFTRNEPDPYTEGENIGTAATSLRMRALPYRYRGGDATGPLYETTQAIRFRVISGAHQVRQMDGTGQSAPNDRIFQLYLTPSYMNQDDQGTFGGDLSSGGFRGGWLTERVGNSFVRADLGMDVNSAADIVAFPFPELWHSNRAVNYSPITFQPTVHLDAGTDDVELEITWFNVNAEPVGRNTVTLTRS